MDATKGTGTEKELFPSTASTAGAVDSFSDVSYYSTCTVKAAKCRYVLFNWG